MKSLLISRAEETRNRSAEANALVAIGNVFIKKGKYQEADKYLRESLRLFSRIRFEEKYQKCLCRLCQLKCCAGKATEALGYLKILWMVHDSLLNVTKPVISTSDTSLSNLIREKSLSDSRRYLSASWYFPFLNKYISNCNQSVCLCGSIPRFFSPRYKQRFHKVVKTGVEIF